VAAPEDDIVIASTAAARVVPRKLSLRVSGAKLGSLVRPARPGAVVPALVPARTFGLRVHASALAPRETPVACVDDYDAGQ
jgi:hypothetical protein